MKSKHDRGFSALGVLVALPVLSAAFLLGVLPTLRLLSERRLQTLADEIAVDAARFLPDEHSAETFGAERVTALASAGISGSARVREDGVVVELFERGGLPWQAALATAGAGGDPADDSLLRRSALAAPLPVDAVVIVSASLRVVPWGGSGAAPSAWALGGEAEAFSSCPPTPSGDAPRRHCANPILSLLKRAALHIVDRFTSPRDRVAVIFAPGHRGEPFDVLFDLDSPPSAQQAAEDLLCASLSLAAPQVEHLALPAPPWVGAPPVWDGCALGRASDACAIERTNLPDHCASSLLTSRRGALHARSAAARPAPGSVFEALRHAEVLLASPAPERVRARRGTLRARQLVAVLTDELPVSQFAHELPLFESLTSRGAEVALIAVSHPGLNRQEQRELMLGARFGAEHSRESSGLRLRVMAADSPERALDSAVPRLLDELAEPVLRR